VTEESIFLAALEKSSAAERQAFLAEVCGTDVALMARIRQLLDADATDCVLDRARLPDVANWAFVPSAAVGTVIGGRYKLLEEIGAGGMGTVWMAEQQEPVRRKVALKLVKPGMDSKSVLVRFEAERQALALMDHPNIAKVLDGGLTEAGRPFFVMEYLKGVPITDYCDSARLSIHERLQLFVQVCRAVQHAHQKGVIHRDLKPSNILVAPYDDKPVPKVIDFGIAKAMHGTLTDRTMHTGHQTVLGTPPYMSPEQARLNNLDVDTRSDIYSLGALLYELLTGTTPLVRERLAEAGWDEARRLIREEEPPRPSARLSATATLPALAACRQTEPAGLMKQVRGELDWIVMKALEKDRNRRYETANSFALDVQRLLAGEPVLAVPPSAGYRLRKAARKHRTALAVAGTITLLLVAGVAVSTALAVWAFHAEASSRAAADDARHAQVAEAQRAAGEQKALRKAIAAAEAEQKATAQSLKRQQQIVKGYDVLLAIFYDVDFLLVKQGNEPLEAVLARRLVKVAGEIDGEAIGDPLLVASLQQRLGLTLRDLGYPEEAIPLLLKVRETNVSQHGPDHLNTLTSMANLGTAYRAAAKLDLALPLLKETFKRCQAKLGANHPHTLASLNNLALAYASAAKLDLALPLLEESVKRHKANLGTNHPDTLTSMHNLAMGYVDARKLGLAVPLYEATLKLRKAELGADHPDTFASMTGLGSAYRQVGNVNAALPLPEECYKRCQARLGVDHPRTLSCMLYLGLTYRDAMKLNLAVPLLKECFQRCQAKLGADHIDTLTCMDSLAEVYMAARRPDLALPLFEEALKHRQAKLPADHPNVLATMEGLAACYGNSRRLDLALPLLEEVLKRRQARLPADHPDMLSCMNNLAITYQAVGMLDQALPLLEEVLKRIKAKQGADHPHTLVTILNLAKAYKAAAKLDLALPLFREAALGTEKRHFTNEYADHIVGHLIACHEDLKQLDHAEVWRRKWLAVVKARAGSDSPAYADKMAGLGRNLLNQQKWPEAETILRDCLALREKNQPAAWTTFETRSLLGGALLGQKKYAAAEPLLLAGYEGMKQRQRNIPPQRKIQLVYSLQRLVQLYDALEKKDETAKWRKELESIARGAERQSDR
jgi:hypothetical protein